jgi:hypothetical protein
LFAWCGGTRLLLAGKGGGEIPFEGGDAERGAVQTAWERGRTMRDRLRLRAALERGGLANLLAFDLRSVVLEGEARGAARKGWAS